MHHFLGYLQIAYTLTGIISGVLFFREYDQMSSLGIGMYALGMTGMIAGIYLSLPPRELEGGLQQWQGGFCAHNSSGTFPAAV
jgi:hypothetical protein